MSGQGGKPKTIEPGYSNAFWNVLQPYYGGGKYIMGSATYVAIETLVGQAVRKTLGAPTNWGESMETHAYSVPMLGQLNFGDGYAGYPIGKGVKVDIMKEAVEGGKAIPAAIAGFTACKLRRDGLRLPTYANRDFMYLLVGKILSRPLTSFIFTSLPQDFQAGLAVLNELSNRQKAVIDAQKDGKDL